MSGYEDGGGGEGSQGAGPPQNVKPKPNQEDQNRKEDFTRKERPPKARRSRSSDSDRGRRSERDRQQRGRRPRGRSEESRRGVAKKGDRPGEEEEAECNVCFCSYDNVFKTPKLLACGHTFCLECLARINVTSQEVRSLSCPLCRELTALPHGHDLPRLGTNQDIIGRLPSDMQRALSIRFKRSKGKLMLKHPPPRGKPASLFIPTKTRDPPPAAPGGDIGLAEQGGATAASVVDVGRPPSRMRGRLRRLFRSDRCYYAVVASIITITLALMLVGILAFIITPRLSPPARPVWNQTESPPSTENHGHKDP